MSKDVKTTTAGKSSTTSGATTTAAGGTSNEAMLSQVQQAGEVSGPMGRVFQRVLGVDRGGEDQAFTRDQLRRYLDRDLQLAENEWFRGTKLDGVADALMQQLDQDGSGTVSWGEFMAFEAQTFATVAPGAGAGATDAQVQAAASQRFGQIDASRDGRLSMTEIQSRTAAELPRGTEHADLIAQLAARIALDAVDTDQRSRPVADRQLSQTEWTTAAGQMTR